MTCSKISVLIYLAVIVLAAPKYVVVEIRNFIIVMLFHWAVSLYYIQHKVIIFLIWSMS